MKRMFFAVALALVSLASTAQSVRSNVWSSESKAESNSSFAESRQTSLKINMDPSVKPGDDFWQYAVGGWLKAIPPAAPSSSTLSGSSTRPAQSIAAPVLARSRRQECKIVPFGCNFFAFSATNRSSS